jgi:thiol-disulfide isomerase/thioredoxin
MKLLLSSLLLVLNLSAYAIEVGDRLPPCTDYLQTRLTDGSEIKMCVEDFQKKNFLLIEFMSIYCGSCLRAMPVINRIGIKYDTTVATHFVTLDRSSEDLEQFIQEWGEQIDHPLLMDKERFTRKPYRIKYTPTTILVNSAKEVIYKHVGEFEDADIAQLESLLK